MLHLALFATGLLWLFAAHTAAAHAARGFSTLLSLPLLDHLLRAVFELLLLLAGFTALEWIATRQGSLSQTNALPWRATTGREFRLGFALGWAMLVAVALLIVVFGQLHSLFWFAGRAWMIAAIEILTLALSTLVAEIAFRGFLFRELINAVGEVAAMVLMAMIYALVSSFSPNSGSLSVTVVFIFGFLYSIAYLRTHALWTGWGIHFGWTVMMGVFFGLPIMSSGVYSSVVSSDLSGPAWLNGGVFGPDGSTLAIAAALGGMAVLYQMTREFSWQYTHTPIVAGGYAVDPPPPAEHLALERSASFSSPAAPASLIQIQAATSQTSSTVAAIDKHLRTGNSEPPVE